MQRHLWLDIELTSQIEFNCFCFNVAAVFLFSLFLCFNQQRANIIGSFFAFAHNYKVFFLELSFTHARIFTYCLLFYFCRVVFLTIIMIINVLLTLAAWLVGSVLIFAIPNFNVEPVLLPCVLFFCYLAHFSLVNCRDTDCRVPFLQRLATQQVLPFCNHLQRGYDILFYSRSISGYSKISGYFS